MPAQRFAFGSFVLDSSRGMLLHRGLPIALGNRALALLQALVAARGQVVTRSELIDAAWPGSIVEESNLTVQIAQLRKHLGDGEERIATVPRIGYRFLGEIQPLDETVEPAASALHATEQKTSIAVLPFTNMSSDPEQEFFADGLAEDLISDLSRVPGLLVIARNSSFTYKGKPVDLRTVARELGVRYVVEGSVRRAAARVRISVQLIDTADQRHLWVDRFDRDLAEVFSLQDEIVSRIVNALADVLPSGKLIATRRSKNLNAYDLFIQARPLVTMSPEGNKAARPLLEKSLELDPDFAGAHAWLAMSYHFGWLYWGQEAHHSKELTAARRAVALDSQSADAHMAFGYLLAYDGNLSGGIAETELTLRLNPNYADAWLLFADILVFQGKPDEAITRARNAFSLNPLPPQPILLAPRVGGVRSRTV